MKYIKTKNGILYSYDEEVTNFTFVFKNGKWRVSQVVYGLLLKEDGVEVISEQEANAFTDGATVEHVLSKVRGVLDTSI